MKIRQYICHRVESTFKSEEARCSSEVTFGFPNRSCADKISGTVNTVLLCYQRLELSVSVIFTHMPSRVLRLPARPRLMGTHDRL